MKRMGLVLILIIAGSIDGIDNSPEIKLIRIEKGGVMSHPRVEADRCKKLLDEVKRTKAVYKRSRNQALRDYQAWKEAFNSYVSECGSDIEMDKTSFPSM